MSYTVPNGPFVRVFPKNHRQLQWTSQSTCIPALELLTQARESNWFGDLPPNFAFAGYSAVVGFSSKTEVWENAYLMISFTFDPPAKPRVQAQLEFNIHAPGWTFTWEEFLEQFRPVIEPYREAYARQAILDADLKKLKHTDLPKWAYHCFTHIVNREAHLYAGKRPVYATTLNVQGSFSRIHKIFKKLNNAS